MLLRRNKKSGREASKRFRRVAFEALEERALLAGLPFGAMPDDTMEFMMGNVVVTPVFFESDGSLDTSTEDWNPNSILATKTKIEEGLQWWVDSLEAINDVHTLNFIVDWQFADNPVATEMEPINRRSQDHVSWGNEFLDSVGFKTPSSSPSSQIQSDIRDFNDAQRQANGADWAFTILVANSENDADDQWNGSGSIFSRAFAFSGGRMIVMPSGRPASTVAHEVGHQAWALDEYAFAGHYLDQRGYLDIPNTNAVDNPNHTHEDSIMSNGGSLDAAFAGNTSSLTSLQMVGWRDTDNDGVFDIFDVPHKLTGSGKAVGTTYEFNGSAQVQTLANENGKLFGDVKWVSDITLNKVDEVQYRIDGGSWVTLQSPQEYEVTLDLQIPLPDTNTHTVEIRTVTLAADRSNGGQQTVIASSHVFSGQTETHEATAEAGISGFVYLDLDEDQSLDATDRGLRNWTVELRDSSGQVQDLNTVVEPDDFNTETVITTATSGVTLTAQGTDVSGIDVKAILTGGSTSTGSGVFGFDFATNISSTAWGDGQSELRMDFDSPVKSVSIDAVGELNNGYGRLDVFDSSNNLLARYTTDELVPGEFETMMLGRAEGDIAYAVASGHASTFIRLDRMMFGVEATTQTDFYGVYNFPYLEAGDYYVHAIAPTSTFESVSPATVMVSLADMQVETHVDFAERSTAPWHNAVFPVDVNASGALETQDAFVLITGLRDLGIGPLPTPGPGNEPPPYYDVNANNLLDLTDAFITIAALRDQFGGSGEGEENDGQGSSGSQNGPSSASPGEGESAELPLVARQLTRLDRGRDADERFALAEAVFESRLELNQQPDAPFGPSWLASDVNQAQTNHRISNRDRSTRTENDSASLASLAGPTNLWALRDLSQLNQERDALETDVLDDAEEDELSSQASELEASISDISEEVGVRWRDQESTKKSSKSELPLK